MTPDDFAKVLDTIASKLSGPAQHIYEITVRQVMIEAISQIALLAFCIIFALILAKLTFYTYGKVSSYDWENEHLTRYVLGTFAFGISAIALFACTFLAITSNLSSWVTALANPEYAALTRIIFVLK